MHHVVSLVHYQNRERVNHLNFSHHSTSGMLYNKVHTFWCDVHDVITFTACQHIHWFLKVLNCSQQGVVDYYHVYTLHSAPIPGSTPPPPPPPGQSDPSCRVSLTGVYTVILLKDQTPQEGQNEWVQLWNFACYTWKCSIHCGGRPSFLFIHTKMWCQTCGVEPYKFGGAQNAGQTPQSGQVICIIYTEGQKAGSDPAIGALCKCGICWNASPVDENGLLVHTI